jgi:hypothetical protein
MNVRQDLVAHFGANRIALCLVSLLLSFIVVVVVVVDDDDDKAVDAIGVVSTECVVDSVRIR